ncbi:hypothetical protein [Actinokineospora diospyrosa]|uniref:Immunity protein 50 of polymorphic toxin system n=1 Tax=Actinokineospora diospyrosa TaxID=103728 RepID=A0ABT1I9P9_9PSEU|nr:hypothetical protein [Actinokineospora diospyrosa]MCP2269350.1 hypothetical protein [Actinokineospora diospyrosa]
MRYVELYPEMSAIAYLAELGEIAPALPEGARAFATDPEHYNFFGLRCVHDLEFNRLSVFETGYGKTGASLWLIPNRFKHDDGLYLRYHDIISITVDVPHDPDRESYRWPGSLRLDDLKLDEVLSHPHGCTHELAFQARSTMTITCADLTATWTLNPNTDDECPPPDNDDEDEDDED